MVDVKHFRDASEDIAGDFGALREEVAKLSASVSELVRAQASSANAVMEGTESARQRLSSGAARGAKSAPRRGRGY